MLGWRRRAKQPSMGSALPTWICLASDGGRNSNENQPDLRRNSSPDTASITIGGSA
jgi:hypothetical protein